MKKNIVVPKGQIGDKTRLANLNPNNHTGQTKTQTSESLNKWTYKRPNGVQTHPTNMIPAKLIPRTSCNSPLSPCPRPAAEPRPDRAASRESPCIPASSSAKCTWEEETNRWRDLFWGLQVSGCVGLKITVTHSSLEWHIMGIQWQQQQYDKRQQYSVTQYVDTKIIHNS